MWIILYSRMCFSAFFHMPTDCILMCSIEPSRIAEKQKLSSLSLLLPRSQKLSHLCRLIMFHLHQNSVLAKFPLKKSNYTKCFSIF
jgi:hypothetical protein